MTLGNSPKVSSNQEGLHPNLTSILQKHLSTIYQKPIADHTQCAFEQACLETQKKGFASIVLDTGCGTGESTLHLARQFPESMVWGIDKSSERLQKMPSEVPSNVLYMRADLVDLWLLVHQAKIPVAHQALYYPNPWPKAHHLMRRWHGHPVFQTILALQSSLELRTNWETYAMEFATALQLAGRHPTIKSFEPQNSETAFERKYIQSGHSFFKVCDHRHSF